MRLNKDLNIKIKNLKKILRCYKKIKIIKKVQFFKQFNN